jgi:hypothetical protein
MGVAHLGYNMWNILYSTVLALTSGGFFRAWTIIERIYFRTANIDEMMTLLGPDAYHG